MAEELGQMRMFVTREMVIVGDDGAAEHDAELVDDTEPVDDAKLVDDAELVDDAKLVEEEDTGWTGEPIYESVSLPARYMQPNRTPYTEGPDPYWVTDPTPSAPHATCQDEDYSGW